MKKNKKEISTPRTYLDYLYMLFFALFPFIHVSGGIDDYLEPRYLYLAGFTLLLAFLHSFEKRRAKFSPGWGGWLLLVFWALSWVSASGAINYSESLNILSRMAATFGFFLITHSLLIQKRVHWSSIATGIVFMGVISCLHAASDILKAMGSGEFPANIYDVLGLYGHKNLLSGALMLMIPFGIALYFRKGKYRYLYLLLVFLLLLVIFVLRTRAVWVGIFTGVALLGVIYLLYRRKTESMRLPYWIPVLFFLIASVPFVSLLHPDVNEQLVNRANLNKRIGFWQNSLEMVKEKPVFGTGPGQWRIYFPKYGLDKVHDRKVYNGETTINRPHNDYLWVWSEHGSAGLVLFLGFMILFFYAGLRLIRSSGENRAPAIAMLFLLAAYASYSFFDFPLERAEHQSLFLSAAAIVLALSGKAGMRKEAPSLSPYAALAVAAMALFSLNVHKDRLKGEKAMKAVLTANAQQNARAIIPAAQKARNKHYTVDNYANPLLYYSGLGKLHANRPEAAAADFEAALEDNPHSIVTLNQFGNYYKLKKEYDKALEYYRKAVDYSPRYIMAKLSIAEALLLKKEMDKAAEYFSGLQVRPKNKKYLALAEKILPYHYKNRIDNNDDPVKKEMLVRALSDREIAELHIKTQLERKEKMRKKRR